MSETNGGKLEHNERSVIKCYCSRKKIDNKYVSKNESRMWWQVSKPPCHVQLAYAGL